MYTIKIIRVAEEALLEIVHYISEKLKSSISAFNLMNLIEEKIKILEESPFSDIREPPVSTITSNRPGTRILLLKCMLGIFCS